MKFLISLIFPIMVGANPYWEEQSVPQDFEYLDYSRWIQLKGKENKLPIDQEIEAKEALRVSVAWDAETENYSIENIVIENSGTDSLILRSQKESPWGSYKARFYYGKSMVPTYHDSIGTGKEYRKLARVITFRIPVPEADVRFEMLAENPKSGEMEVVLNKKINIKKIKKESYTRKDLQVRVLHKAKQSPSLKVVIYGDGYLEKRVDSFWQIAQKTVDAMVSTKFPGVERMEFIAAVAPSNVALGKAQKLELPPVQRDSFLGLYFPYWNAFGRWYHVVYPTSEEYFRKNLALVPYDYNIIIMDSNEYWGVGNYKTHTAIPSGNSSFVYLLTHELGHFLGLNEEYEGGGRTELEFAPEITEAWSQNMTFLPGKSLKTLKWGHLIDNLDTPVPTPHSFWIPGAYGAYRGGYADSQHKLWANHKPGFTCVMDRHQSFCPICHQGIIDVINHDLALE